MNYAEILSRRLKKAGRDFAKGQAVDKKEQLQVILREIMQEGQDTGTFFPWTEAVRRLHMEEMTRVRKLVPADGMKDFRMKDHVTGLV